jgi:hypothetical protein
MGRTNKLPGGATVISQIVDEVLKGIETGKPEALAEGLAVLIEKGRGGISPIIEALRQGHVLARWAAAATLGELGDTQAIPALAEALKDENLSVRVRAAQSLAKLGSPQGIPTLIVVLASDEVVIGHPPELASDYANQVLESVTGQSFGFDGSADPTTKSAVIKRWQDWWGENQSLFRLVR